MQLVTFERRSSAEEQHRIDLRAAPREDGLGFEPVDAGRPGSRRLGAVVPEGAHAGDVVDLNCALAMKLAFEDAGAPEGEADSLIPADALRFLQRFDTGLRAARETLHFVLGALERYDAPDLVRAGVIEPRRRIRICAPVVHPGKVLVAVGEREARGRSRPRATASPVLALKASSAVIGPGEEIVLPAACGRVDFQGALAAVIGRRLRNARADEALGAVAGYTIGIDVCAEEIPALGLPRGIGRSCDTFAPLGPLLVTADAVPDPHDLGIRTVVSGKLVNATRTKETSCDLAETIALASTLMVLEPGDVVMSTAPAGSESGAARRPLREGDVLEIEIERLGRLHNHVRRESDRR